MTRTFQGSPRLCIKRQLRTRMELFFCPHQPWSAIQKRHTFRCYNTIPPVSPKHPQIRILEKPTTRFIHLLQNMLSSTTQFWECHKCKWSRNNPWDQKCKFVDQGTNEVCGHIRCCLSDKNSVPCDTHWKCHVCQHVWGTKKDSQYCWNVQCNHEQCQLSLGGDPEGECTTTYLFRCFHCKTVNPKDNEFCQSCNRLHCWRSSVITRYSVLCEE